MIHDPRLWDDKDRTLDSWYMKPHRNRIVPLSDAAEGTELLLLAVIGMGLAKTFSVVRRAFKFLRSHVLHRV